MGYIQILVHVQTVRAAFTVDLEAAAERFCLLPRQKFVENSSCNCRVFVIN